MKITDTISFSWRLLRARWKRNAFVFLGIFLGAYLLTLFFSFSEGLEKNILDPVKKKLEAEMLVVSPRPEGGSALNPFRYFQNPARREISLETVSQIQSFPEVKKVDAETRIPFPVAASTEILFGVRFDFDTTLSGFSEEAVREYLPVGQTFSGSEEVVPVFLSPLLIEIYNSTLAELIPGATRKTLDDFVGREIDFTFGKSNYFGLLYSFPTDTSPRIRKAKVVGFAPFLSPFTFAIPESLAKEMRSIYERISPEKILPHSLLVTPRSLSNVASLEQKVADLGLVSKDLSGTLQNVGLLFHGLQTLLLVSGGAILLVSLLFLAFATFFNVLEYRKSIGILRAIGASKIMVQAVFLLQAGILSLLALLSGTLFAFFSAKFLNTLFLRHIPVFAVQISSVFLLSPLLFLEIFAGFLAVAFLTSYFPARTAASMDPLQAILD